MIDIVDRGLVNKTIYSAWFCDEEKESMRVRDLKEMSEWERKEKNVMLKTVMVLLAKMTWLILASYVFQV